MARNSIKNTENASNSGDSGAFTTITFRINTSVMDKLRQESESKGMSINSFVNQLLKHYTEWDAFEPRIGMIPFPKNVLRNMFSDMSEEQIIKLATNIGQKTAIEMAMFMKGRINVFDFVSWMEMRLKNSGSEIVHRVTEKDDDGDEATMLIHALIIRHDMGEKWSLYLRSLLESSISDVFKARAFDFILTDAMFSFRFETKKNYGEAEDDDSI